MAIAFSLLQSLDIKEEEKQSDRYVLQFSGVTTSQVSEGKLYPGHPLPLPSGLYRPRYTPRLCLLRGLFALLRSKCSSN